MKLEFEIEYSQEKNLWLKRTRGIGFEKVKKAMARGDVLSDLEHHDKENRPNQRILVITINDYAFGVPYVYDKERNVAFLKTIYPSRFYTKKYIKYEKK